jgi:hypothetical protein
MDNYKVLQNFIKSKGWWIIVEEIDLRIKDVENILLTPISDIDNLLKTKMTSDEKLKLIEMKQKEREYLIWIKWIPQEILDSEIKEV